MIQSGKLCRLVIAATGLAAGLATGFAAAPAGAQSSNEVGAAGSTSMTLPTLPNSTVEDVSRAEGSTKTTPAYRLLPQFVPGSTDWSRPYADALDREYDKWLALKKQISDQYNLDLAIDYSFFPQWGTKGQPVYANVYYPSATWRIFTDTAIGSGHIDVVTSHQAYFSKQDTATQATRLGLINFANDWTRDNFAWSQVTYEHKLPGNLSWLSFTVGQYNLFTFDPNQYAANAQTSFINYSFAQDATQTFPNAGLGAYGQVKTPDGQFNFAGGVQGATDLNGGRLTTQGFDQGKLVNWGNAQWTPKFEGFGAGIYSLLVYDQPLVPFVSGHSVGTSFSMSQELSEKYGVFLRLNNATGADIPIRRSYAWGGVWNNPIGRNKSDQLGVAAGWNKTNHDLTGYAGTRDGEWVSEVFYKATIFKGMHITPDVQVFWTPALASKGGPEAVFTVRTTVSF